MQDFFLSALTIAYGATGIVSFIAYWPTIKDVHRLKKPSANSSSYVLWTITTGIAFLYALTIPDLLLQIVAGLQCIACGIVLVLSLGLARHA